MLSLLKEDRGGFRVVALMNRSAPSLSRSTDRQISMVVLLVACASIMAPTAAVLHHPMVDWPNHLARAFLLSRWDASPRIRAVFEWPDGIIPNLGLDVGLQPLLHLLPPLEAGRLFLIAVALFVPLSLAYAMSGVDRGLTVRAGLAAALALSSPWLYGFINYMMGLAVYFAIVGVWIRWRDDARWPWWKFVTLAAAGTLGFIVHMSTVAFIGLTVGAFSLHRLVCRKQWWLALRDGLPFLHLPVLTVLLAPSSAPGAAPYYLWGAKAIALLAPFRTYSRSLDLAVLMLVVVLFAWLVILNRHLITIRGTAATTAVLFVLAFLATPYVAFTSAAADSRYVLPIYFWGLASIEWRSSRASLVLAAGAILMCAARGANVYSFFTSYERAARSALQTLKAVPSWQLVHPHVLYREDPDLGKRDASFSHLPHYATVTDSVLVTNFFSVPGVQPLLWREHNDGERCVTSLGPAKACPGEFVWEYRPTRQFAEEMLRLGWQPVRQDTLSRLWAPPPSKSGKSLRG